MDISKVIDFAKSKGYETAKIGTLPKWHGYDAYEPIFDTKEMPCIGLPFMILVKGEAIRMSTPDEAMAYLDDTIINEE